MAKPETQDAARPGDGAKPADAKTPPGLGDLTLWVAVAIADRAARRTRGDRLTSSDVPAMQALADRPLAITELATVLGITRQAAAKVSHGLGERGLAGPMPDARDGRVRRVALTPAGQAALAKRDQVMNAVDQEVRAAIGDETVDQAVGSITDLLDHLGWPDRSRLRAVSLDR